MAATKISLDVNVPLTGTVKYVDMYPEKPNPKEEGKVLPAQWALTGQWQWTTPEGETRTGEGKVYIDAYQLAASPVSLGMVEQNGAWDDGNPRYKWIYNSAVRVVKTEKDRKRHVTIARLTDAAPTVAGAASPPPAVAAPVAQPSGQAPVRAPTGTPSPVPHTQDPAWGNLTRQYKRAVAIATSAWGDALEPTALVAAAATVFIEANKRGLVVEALEVPSDPRHLGAWNDMPAAIERGRKQDESDLRF